MCQTFDCMGHSRQPGHFGLVAFSVLQCRDLLVYVYFLFGLADMLPLCRLVGRD